MGTYRNVCRAVNKQNPIRGVVLETPLWVVAVIPRHRKRSASVDRRNGLFAQKFARVGEYFIPARIGDHEFQNGIL